MSYLQDVLPLEVICRILLLLLPLDRFRLRLTCRRMYRAVNDLAIWSSLSYDFHHTPSKQALEETMKFCSPSVKTLEINGRGSVSRFPWTRFMKNISKCSSSLLHISFLGIFPSPKQLDSLLDICTTLAHLELEMEGNKIRYFPKISSLKSFEIRLDVVQDVTSLLLYWASNAFSPQTLIVTTHRSVSIEGIVHDVKHFLRSVAPPLGVKCIFRLQYAGGTLKIVPKYSVFEVVLENSELSVPITICKTVGQKDLIIMVSNQQCGYLLTCNQLPAIHRHLEFTTVGPVLVHLVLNNSKEVISQSLCDISRQCPKLRFLSLCGCSNVFEDMSGLASVSANCINLEGLNITRIHSFSNVSELWSIILSLRKLRHLAIEVCSVPLSYISTAEKMKALLLLQVGGEVCPSVHCAMCYMSDKHLLVLEQLMPEGLKVLLLSELPKSRSSVTIQALKHLFCCLPKLEYLSLDSSSIIHLPTDAMCYPSIERFWVKCPVCYVNSDFTSALVANRCLTHCYIQAKMIDLDAVSKLVQAPRLVSLYLGLYKRPAGSWKSKVCQAAKISNIPDFSAYVLPHPAHPVPLPYMM